MCGRPVLAGGLLRVLPILAAVSCGGTTTPPAPSTPATPTPLVIVTTFDYRFDPATIRVRHGTATFVLNNVGQVPHNMLILDADGDLLGKSPVVAPGATVTFSVPNLAIGEDQYKDTQPGHAYQPQGMAGDLIVY